MGPGHLGVVVISTQEPGIVGKRRKGLVSRKADAEVSQLHAGLTPVASQQLEVSVHLSVDIADYDQPFLPISPSHCADTDVAVPR